MSYADKPEETYLKRRRPSGLLSWLSIPLFLFIPIPDYLKVAFRAPVDFIATRPENPAHEIVVRATPEQDGGLTNNQREVLRNILATLPAAHVQQVDMVGATGASLAGGKLPSETVGLADYRPRIISVDTQQTRNPDSFQFVILHELGHLTQEFCLTPSEQKAWSRLRPPISRANPHLPDIRNVVRDYSQNNDQEDFADTYATYVRSAPAFALRALNEIKAGYDGILERYLYMSAFFSQPDGYVTSYANELPTKKFTIRSIGEDDVVDAVLEGFGQGPPPPLLRAVEERYYRTDNAITIGAYTYRLKGKKIVAIASRGGETIIDNLSVPVPEIVFQRMKKTEEAPRSEQKAVVECQMDDGLPCEGEGHGTIVDELSTTSPAQFVSDQTPSDYVPLTTPEGYALLAQEQALIAHPENVPTVTDAARPHGDFTHPGPGF